MSVILLAASAVGFLTSLGLFWVFFRDRGDFVQCLKCLLLTGPFAFLRGDYLDRWFRSARVFTYLVACAAVGVGTYYAFAALFPG